MISQPTSMNFIVDRDVIFWSLVFRISHKFKDEYAIIQQVSLQNFCTSISSSM